MSFATFRDRIRPGARETWRVTRQGARGRAGEARAAELLAYMYDRSLDAFVPSQSAERRSCSTRTAPQGGYLRASLGVEGATWMVNVDFETAGSMDGPSRRPAEVPRRVRNRRTRGAGNADGEGGGRRDGQFQCGVGRRAAPAGTSPIGDVVDGVVVGCRATPPRRAGPERPPSRRSPLRSDFSETAFWKPQLLTDADGSAVIEFQVPDSVTSWNVWVHAITRDLKSGSVHRQTQSVKDLMVRPYVPRFLREGDAAQLKVVVNNASDRADVGDGRARHPRHRDERERAGASSG